MDFGAAEDDMGPRLMSVDARRPDPPSGPRQVVSVELDRRGNESRRTKLAKMTPGLIRGSSEVRDNQVHTGDHLFGESKFGSFKMTGFLHGHEVSPRHWPTSSVAMRTIRWGGVVEDRAPPPSGPDVGPWDLDDHCRALRWGCYTVKNTAHSGLLYTRALDFADHDIAGTWPEKEAMMRALEGRKEDISVNDILVQRLPYWDINAKLTSRAPCTYVNPTNADYMPTYLHTLPMGLRDMRRITLRYSKRWECREAHVYFHLMDKLFDSVRDLVEARGTVTLPEIVISVEERHALGSYLSKKPYGSFPLMRAERSANYGDEVVLFVLSLPGC